jgi:kumamolisin
MATKKKSTPHLLTAPRTILPGSGRAPFSATLADKPAPQATKFTVSVMLKRKTPLKAANRLGEQRLTRTQYRQQHGSDPAAVKLVRAFAKQFGLTIAPDTPSPSAAPSNSPAP